MKIDVDRHSWKKSSTWNAGFVLVSALVLMTSCASVKTVRNSKPTDEARTVPEIIQEDANKAGQVVSQTSSGEITIRDVKLKNTQFDFPITINSRVEYWVDYFLGRGRIHFEKYLERSELFIPFITPLLKANGMPEDLVYLAMIESGFNNHARSRAKAVGPWQFISATGKRYGLMVNWWVDERRDTRKSTLAAVGYLKDLYSWFGTWELAAASYNAGEAKLARAVQRFGTKDFWVIARHRFLKQETRDYVPKIIAAALLAKNRTQFGFPASTIKAGSDEAVAGDGEVVKVEKKSEQASYVPHVADGTNETLASILAKEEFENLEGGTLPKKAENNDVPVARTVATPHVSRKGEVSGTQLIEFELSSPADLQKISDASGLSYQTVKSLNPEILRWVTPPTVASYRIKLPSTVKDKFLETYNGESFQKQVQFLAYKSRPGDSLNRIARHFGIKVDPISDLNGVSAQASLRVGTRVLLPMPVDRTRSLASLEVRDPPEFRRRRSRKPRQHKVSYRKRQAAQGRRISLNDG